MLLENFWTSSFTCVKRMFSSYVWCYRFIRQSCCTEKLRRSRSEIDILSSAGIRRYGPWKFHSLMGSSITVGLFCQGSRVAGVAPETDKIALETGRFALDTHPPVKTTGGRARTRLSLLRARWRIHVNRHPPLYSYDYWNKSVCLAFIEPWSLAPRAFYFIKIPRGGGILQQVAWRVGTRSRILSVVAGEEAVAGYFLWKETWKVQSLVCLSTTIMLVFRNPATSTLRSSVWSIVTNTPVHRALSAENNVDFAGE